jgi:hypothetical protein
MPPAKNSGRHGVAAVFPAARLSTRQPPAGGCFASTTALAGVVPFACGLNPSPANRAVVSGSVKPAAAFCLGQKQAHYFTCFLLGQIF